MSIIDPATWLVAKREITEAIRAKAFKILLGISAVAIAGIIVIFHFASNSSSESVTDLGIVGNSVTDEAGLDALGDAIGSRIEVVSFADDDVARAAVADGDVDAAILADDASILTNEHVDLDGDSKLAIVINVLRSDLALNEGLGSAGLTPSEIDTVRGSEPPPVNSIEPEDDDGDDKGRVGTAMTINVLLFLLLQTYGGWVVSGVTREKSSRVVEVLLSTVTARQLMFGKILGVGIVALIHASGMVVTALVTAKIVGLDVLDGFRPGDLAIGAIWFLLGYALYCCAFAAAGSLATRSEDAQGVTLPVMLPLIAGYIIGFSAGGGANTLLWILAFFPPTAVLCMPVLSATGEVAIWMVVLSMVITAVAAYLVGLLAARIYARSILKTGKRVSWKEALSRKAAEAA